MKKHIIVPAILASAILVSGAVTGSVYAHGFGMFGDGQTSFIQKIAQRFGLNESDVQGFFDEMHTQRQQQMQKDFESRLHDAVSNGTITEVQKQAMLEHHNQMHQNHGNFEEFKNLTPEQRREKHQELQKQEEAWANENGITLETLRQLMGGRKFRMNVNN